MIKIKLILLNSLLFFKKFPVLDHLRFFEGFWRTQASAAALPERTRLIDSPSPFVLL
jgi:hypothetical protein